MSILNSTKLSKIMSISAIVVVALAVPITTYLIQQRQDIRDQAESGNTYKVCLDGGTDCDFDFQGGENDTAIQQAVETAKDKDTILLEDGEYVIETHFEPYEYLFSGNKMKMYTCINVENKDITLKGVNQHSSKINCQMKYNNPVPEQSMRYLMIIIDGNVSIDNVDLNNQSSGTSRDGGILSLEESTLDIVSSEMISRGGSGIFALDSTILTINESTFTECGEYGISVYGQSQVNISNTLFDNNNYLGIDFRDETKGIVRDSTFLNHFQMGIRTYDNSNVLVENCIFESNGHGVMCYADSTLELKDSIITKSNWDGVNSSENCEMYLYNNIIHHNKRTGVWISLRSNGHIINNTIAENKGEELITSAGIFVYEYADADITNNIIYDNNIGIHRDTYHDREILNEYNNLYGNDQDYRDIIQGDGNIFSDPKFADEIYRLASDSPAIDTGDPDICDEDGTRSDIGAYGGGYVCDGSEDPVDPSANDILLKINLSLERKNDNANDEVRVKVVKDEKVIDFFTSVDSDGNTKFKNLGKIDEGEYLIYVKPSDYISKYKKVVLTKGENIVVFDQEFRVGDTNFSEVSYDFINALDFSTFIKYLRNQSRSGDFNLDDTVNAIDYSIALKTYKEDRQGPLISDPR